MGLPVSALLIGSVCVWVCVLEFSYVHTYGGFSFLRVNVQACARAHLRCLISQHTEPSREVWSTMSDE